MILAAVLVSPLIADDSGQMSASSPEFAQGKAMPLKSSLKGDNKSPQLLISSIPFKAKTLAIIVDDPDAPSGLWTHWLLWNVPPNIAVISEGEVPKGAAQGKNSFGRVRYDGPAPPSGTHRYVFHVFALDEPLSLPAGSSRDELEAAMKGHVVGKAEFFGTYSANP
jgi:Raf kinase inhibitor-like YbhB/YbcL family protein